MNWVDTAAIYGLGRSEEVVGQALADLPASERPLIFTKCGMVWAPERPTDFPRRLLAPESIRRECEASLAQLGVEAIDLYQFHWPDDTGVPVEESWGEMLRLARRARSAGAASPTSTRRFWSAASAWATSILCSRRSR